MGSDKILKKTAFGGFKREDVLNYIEQLQQEIVSLKREVSDGVSCKRELENVKSAKDYADSELAALREENAALKEQNADLIEKNASYTLKMEEAQVSIEEYERKLRSCESKIEIIEHKFSELEITCARVGDAEKLIEEAKSSVAVIADKAKGSVESVRADILNASERIKTACVNFDSSAASLKSSAENLLASLAEATQKLDSIGAEEA